MFILTDGKNYIMENPVSNGVYISTSSPAMAKKFTFKQARNLLKNKSKRMSWIKSYYMVDQDTGKVAEMSQNYKGNKGIYTGANDVEFDKSIIGEIYGEAEKITNLAGWDMNQLKIYKEKLNIGLSKCDSAESDVKHAIQEYRKKNDGKKPPAHKAAKIGYMLLGVRESHENIKQCLKYIQVLEDAINNSFTIEKTKAELEKAKYAEYQGRTEYYQLALEILGSGVKKDVV